MRHDQGGSTLVVAMILLAIITVVAVYTLEGTNIQSKMIANSLLSTFTYQECRNEQEAQIRYYNVNTTKRGTLLTIAGDTPTATVADGNTTYAPPELAPELIETLTKLPTDNTVKSDLDLTWKYIQKAPKSGEEVDTMSTITNYLYENDCIATLSFSQSNQTQGVYVEGLQTPGNVREE